MDLEIVVETDADCFLTMRYQQHGIEPHERLKMVRGVPSYRDPHLAFDNYLEMDEIHPGDKKTHRFKLPFPYVCKTYYWKFVGTVGGVWSPSHSPVFSEHLEEVIEVTKEIYFPTWESLAAIPWQKGTYPCIDLRASSTYTLIPFHIPANFTTLDIAEVIVIPKASHTDCQWTIESMYALEGEAFDTNHEFDFTSTYNTFGKVGQIYKVPCNHILTALAAGHVGGLMFWLRHSEHDAYVLGLRIKYE